ncbi:MAG: hypothetical protein GWN67_26080 [Phycisphaerae bacterium]|nr:hypothetical protein [Phycisphaerae bacterium]NIR63424.1 hypothetical protein [candidate division Zixibacteria bacterium]NIP55560.1 hypothetical protein [Phycisphaerae bacterium]NIS54791.1 hypothetical protein [Phycisphaerae bacterium]NIU11890.1 hypothetical protein [Phycisphaerae bacterium]
MTPQETEIGVIEPLSPAIERVKTILFRPFDIGKWFVIGFCAWLAYLGEGGGSGPRFNFGGQQREFSDESFHHAMEVVIENLYWIIPVAITVFVILLIVGFVMAWLSSRGRFMFLHCVALNKAEVVAPWHKYMKQGNSLFLFRIVLGLISFAIIMLLVAVLVVIGILLFAGGGGPNPLGVILMVLMGLFLIIPTVIIFALIGKFTRDFVVPIMYLRQGTCMTAWREFWPLLTGNKGKFTVYILFQIVIALAVGIIVFACVCITCCCLGCFLAIPYIGTVLMLPILVFDRSYSLIYLRQYDPGYDVFAPEPAEIQAV